MDSIGQVYLNKSKVRNAVIETWTFWNMSETAAISCGQINPLISLLFPCCYVGQVMAGIACYPK